MLDRSDDLLTDGLASVAALKEFVLQFSRVPVFVFLVRTDVVYRKKLAVQDEVLNVAWVVPGSVM